MNLKLLNNKKAVIYARVSNESIYTKKESITNQVDYLLKYAEENGFEIVDIYSDDGFSGSNMKRPSVTGMLNDMKNNKFNVILVTSLSRFSRNYMDAGNYIDHIFPEYGIRFIATGDDYDSATYNDEESFAIKIWLNDMYIKDIGNKIRFANQRRAEKGYMSAGGFYGLQKNKDGAFEIAEDEAKTIRLIFALRLKGLTTGKIRDYLIENEVMSPSYHRYLKTGQVRFMFGRKLDEINPYEWNETRVRQILNDRRYNGCIINRPYIKKNGIRYRNENPVIIPNGLPKIIDDESFNKVQAMFINKGKKTFLRTSKIDRFNMIYCSDCGHKLRFDSTVIRNNGQYSCGYCKKAIISGAQLNKALEDDLRNIIDAATNDHEKIKQILGILNEGQPKCSLKTLQMKKNKLDLDIQNAFEKEMLGEISKAEYDELILKLKDENNQIENQINQYKINKIRLKPLSKNLRTFIEKIKKINIVYNEEDLSVFKEVIERIEVKRISRKEKHIKIKYKVQ